MSLIASPLFRGAQTLSKPRVMWLLCSVYPFCLFLGPSELIPVRETILAARIWAEKSSSVLVTWKPAWSLIPSSSGP